MFTVRKCFTALSIGVVLSTPVMAKTAPELETQTDVLVAYALEAAQQDLNLGVTYDVLDASNALATTDTQAASLMAETMVDESKLGDDDA